MKADISALLGDGGDADDAPSDKPTIGEALGEAPPDDASGTDVTHEAQVEAGHKLLKAFESKDPAAMYQAVCSVIDMEGGGGGSY